MKTIATAFALLGACAGVEAAPDANATRILIMVI
jgi:hypothetical protein